MPHASSRARLAIARATIAAALLLGAAQELPAQLGIPSTSGFGGFGVFAVAAMEGRTNFFASGPPLLGAITRPVTRSVFTEAEPLRSPALLVGGEANYTFANTRTQVFVGGALEDILLLDVAIKLGVRQELPDKSVVSVAGIATPFPQKLWVDPYVEGVPRAFAKAAFPGFRIAWARILGTGLELTFTDRFFRFDAEQSGQWLVDQGRLAPEDVDLLDRNGDNMSFQAAYRFRTGRHAFEPSLTYGRDNRNGGAMANDGLAALVNYRYISPKFILDANLVYGRRTHFEVHPVYGERVSRDRVGGSVTGIVPIEMFGSKKWNVWATTEYFVDNANVEFFDASLSALTLGLGWRGLRQ
jgi:hypothetical protein